ncbi:hypothetical protein GCM10010302_64000 [Streptomyces polychromogenes]|uniref:Histidine kinase/HSP90-like ATPase domain-containing protein n=1 Tax=Streptomyces polychromogenes TaxID=67342 RepID=A0ABN0VSX4_9ACTN
MPSPASAASPAAPPGPHLAASRAVPATPAQPPGWRLAAWVLELAASEVPRLRAAMRRTLRSWGVAASRAEVLLLVATELLSNAVRHAGSEGGASRRVRVTVAITATVGLRSGRLCLDVADGDPALPCVGPQAGAGVGADAEGGRGLLIVNCLVGEAGGRVAAFRVPSGKVVRVRIPAVPVPCGGLGEGGEER